jgi:hypothetical protein
MELDGIVIIDLTPRDRSSHKPGDSDSAVSVPVCPIGVTAHT